MRNPPNRLVTGLVMAVLASGCSLVGGGPPGAEDHPGGAVEETLRAYGGTVTLDGNRLPLVLELVGSGSDYSARLSVPSLDLDAGGAATVDGQRLSVNLEYGGVECAGRLRLVGRFWEGMRRIDGLLTASDCTGEEEGAVVLLLRPGG